MLDLATGVYVCVCVFCLDNSVATGKETYEV